jgi:putative acetyltransferase
MAAYDIRTIRKDDDPQIAALIRSILEEFGVNKPGTVYTDSTTDSISELLNEPGTDYWVVELDGKIVGGCGIYPTKGLPNGCVELVKLYVLPEARGKGIATELMKRSISKARELGYKQIYLESMPELTTAVSLYENVGFKLIPERLGETGHFACMIWMVKDL